ncbi:MAG TPA: bifunctional indole-3-glycerol-phosphate synthase TrpC/phosphoribosylanthranilate isomerase TrpF [Gemmatimonadales bacterium]
MALERILARTRADVAARKAATPLDRLREQCRPSDRDFAAALRRPRTGFILECKRASPSEGVIRDRYDPVAIATAYAPHADAISVLCDRPFFRGSHDHLRAVREAVGVPVLCKDFVVDPWQVWEARAAGADAVLLMLSVLDREGWVRCAAAAALAGIATLTEVHTDRELDLALDLGAEVIGVNNRDLASLQVDLDTTRRLAPRVGNDRVVVCESGIRTHAEVRALAPAVDAFLVGTTLMRSAEVPAAVRRLVYGMTKVCGLTRPGDAVAAWEAGATHGGVIFVEESPRAVDRAKARAVLAAAPLLRVAVFANAAPQHVASLAAELGLAAVQLHGEETPGDVAALRQVLPGGTEIWKAFRVRDALPDWGPFEVDRVLLDTWHPAVRGGTGEGFDWSLVARAPDPDRIILAGGLTPERVADAEALGVGGLDVNSGVEDAPGIKSHTKLAAFFAARRGSGRERDR